MSCNLADIMTIALCINI